MPTITFDPQATPKQADAFMAWVGDTAHGSDCADHAPPGKVFVGEMQSRFVPCDLTIDPTKPETWPRAVYEAGKRDYEAFIAEGEPAPPTEPTVWQCGHCYTFLDDANRACKCPTNHARHLYPTKGEPRVVKQPAKVPVCELCERYLWDGPKSQVNGWSFCGYGCADLYHQSLQPQWKPPEKIGLHGFEYRRVPT